LRIAILDIILSLYKKQEKEGDKEIEEDFYGLQSQMAAWFACTLTPTLEVFICPHKDLENMRNNGTFKIISRLYFVEKLCSN
jgi:hypothetical protein